MYFYAVIVKRDGQLQTLDDGSTYLDLRYNKGSSGNSVVANAAGDISTDITNFDNNLSATDTDVQITLDTLDDALFMKSDVVNSYTKQQYALAIPESQSSALAWNLDDKQSHILTLTGNVTITPSNMKSGATYAMILKQDGTGSRTVTWAAAFKWRSGTAPTLSTGASEVDILTFISDGTNLYGTIAPNFS